MSGERYIHVNNVASQTLAVADLLRHQIKHTLFRHNK